MSKPSFDWDLFISYAHGDGEWVKRQLVEPLQHWRTVNGSPVNVFLAVEAIEAGANWVAALSRAIAASRTVIAVYSPEYFASEMCQLELTKAIRRDPMGRQGTIFALLLKDVDAEVVEDYSHLQWVDARNPQWFDQLVERLQLRQVARVQELRFLTRIPDANVSQTLPEVRVVVEAGGLRVPTDATVTLFSEQGGLQGTLSARCHEGVAVFADLFVTTPATANRLVATAPGCAVGFSDSFAVVAERPVAVAADDLLIRAAGEILFFEQPRSIAIVDDGWVRVFDLTGQEAGRHALNSRVRVQHRGRSGLLFGTWGGDVLWVEASGRGQLWSLPPRQGFAVLGDVCETVAAAEPVFHAGRWSGEVYRLTAQGGIELALHHPDGVQAMCSAEGRLVICDLEGSLCVYRGDKLESQHAVDRVVRRVKAYPGCVVVVGQQRLFQYSFGRAELYAQPCRFELREVHADADRCIAMGTDGRGVIFGHELSLQLFHGMPGAAPASANQDATLCVLRNPDGTHTLLDRGRMVFQHVGRLAVSPASTLAAVGSERGVQLMATDALLRQAPQLG